MGKLKLAVYFNWQLGVILGWDMDFYFVKIPFISIFIGRGESSGVQIFNWYLK